MGKYRSGEHVTNKVPMAPQHTIWGSYVASEDSGKSYITIRLIPGCKKLQK